MSNRRVAVVGGGVVGLATAYQIARNHPGTKVVLFEKEKELATHQSTHNSGVIHSGIYYKPGSLKARNCMRGYNLLLDFCRENKVDFDLCGKIIVATDENELPQLKILFERGNLHGLTGLKMLGPEELRKHEPNVRGLQGIWVPQTGIINFGDYAKALEGKLAEIGVKLQTNCEVKDVENYGNEVIIDSIQGRQSFDNAIFCSGLHSDRLAKKTEPNLDIRIIPFRGEYYDLTPSSANLVKNLIYPVPNPNFPFLGVHFTRMMGGGVEVGPNAVLALSREGYRWSDFQLQDTIETLTWPGFQKVALKYYREGAYEIVRSLSKRIFLNSARKLIPDLRMEDLVPGTSGVRAQACDSNGKLLDDFEIRKAGRIVHVLNAPSPAATSSLSIGLSLMEMIS